MMCVVIVSTIKGTGVDKILYENDHYDTTLMMHEHQTELTIHCLSNLRPSSELVSNLNPDSRIVAKLFDPGVHPLDLLSSLSFVTAHTFCSLDSDDHHHFPFIFLFFEFS